MIERILININPPRPRPSKAKFFALIESKVPVGLWNFNFFSALSPRSKQTVNNREFGFVLRPKVIPIIRLGQFYIDPFN